MPLLPSEPALHPHDLFEQPDPGGESSWWVLHTRARAEKAIARSLHRAAIPFFLPVYEQSRKVGGRVQTSHLPLFPGYLFLRSDEEGRLRALETNQVSSCIRVPDQLTLRQELEAVHRVATSGVPIGPAAQLAPGTVVMIAKGPLEGLRGKVLHRGNRITMVVEVHMIGQGVAVEIEGWMLQSIQGEGTA